jgi:hypothetical protein
LLARTRKKFENSPNSKRNSTTLILPHILEAANLSLGYNHKVMGPYSGGKKTAERKAEKALLGRPLHEQKWRENEADGGKTFSSTSQRRRRVARNQPRKPLPRSPAPKISPHRKESWRVAKPRGLMAGPEASASAPSVADPGGASAAPDLVSSTRQAATL